MQNIMNVMNQKLREYRGTQQQVVNELLLLMCSECLTRTATHSAVIYSQHRLTYSQLQCIACFRLCVFALKHLHSLTMFNLKSNQIESTAAHNLFVQVHVSLFQPRNPTKVQSHYVMLHIKNIVNTSDQRLIQFIFSISILLVSLQEHLNYYL